MARGPQSTVSDVTPGDTLAPNRRVIVAGLALIAGGAALLLESQGWRQAALYLVGGALGVTLYHAAFGFTSAWRMFLVERRGEGIRAQMVMLALASVVFLPVIAGGSLFGLPVAGAFAPVSVSVAVGAFLFGIGMQLAGGCASGTLFALGGGSARMLVTLAAFIGGATIATLHVPWWFDLPSLGSIALGRELGWGPALAVQLTLFGAIVVATLAWQRRSRAPAPRPPANHGPALGRIIRGPWPVLWGAIALALLNIATLALAGHPWTVTFAFSLWGAKTLQTAGVEVAAWPFWTWPFPAQALSTSVLADVTSVMNVGLVFGAVLAAGLAGKVARFRAIPLRAFIAALVGGLLLGYGARLAFGCNIGAFFSGVASGSLHGWLWLITGLAGNYLGLRLRPLFAHGEERHAG